MPDQLQSLGRPGFEHQGRTSAIVAVPAASNIPNALSCFSGDHVPHAKRTNLNLRGHLFAHHHLSLRRDGQNAGVVAVL